MNDTLTSSPTRLLDEILELTAPFAEAIYVGDWRSRAAILSHVSDRSWYLLRENAHWSPSDEYSDCAPLTMTSTRREALRSIGDVASNPLGLKLDTAGLSHTDREALAEVSGLRSDEVK